MASFAKNFSRALLPLALALPAGVACVAGAPPEDGPLGVAQQAVPVATLPPCPDGGTVQLPSAYGEYPETYLEPGYGSGWSSLGYGGYGEPGYGYGYGGLGYGSAYGAYGAYGEPGYLGLGEGAGLGEGTGLGEGDGWGYAAEDGVPAGYGVMAVGDGGLGLCQK